MHQDQHSGLARQAARGGLGIRDPRRTRFQKRDWSYAKPRGPAEKFRPIKFQDQFWRPGQLVASTLIIIPLFLDLHNNCEILFGPKIYRALVNIFAVSVPQKMLDMHTKKYILYDDNNILRYISFDLR